MRSLLKAEVIKKKSYRAFEELMSPFEGFKGIDLQIEALLLAARFIPFVPKIASNIQNWVIANINLSNDQLENYNEKFTQTTKWVSTDTVSIIIHCQWLI